MFARKKKQVVFMKTCHYLAFSFLILMLCGCMGTVRVQPSFFHIEAVGSSEGLPLHVAFVVEETQYRPTSDVRNRIVSGPPDSTTGLSIWREAFAMAGSTFQKSTAPTPDELSRSDDHDAIAHVKLRYRGAFPGNYTSSIEVRIEGAHGEALFEEIVKVKEYCAFTHTVSWDKAAAVIRRKIESSTTIRGYAASRKNMHRLHVATEQEPLHKPGPMSVTESSPIPAPKTKMPGNTILQRWALVIGISEYSDNRVPVIKYANADAKAFYCWLVSPSGAGYNPARVKFLYDEKATGENIREALFNWLKQPIEEDLVTIYYAGHGSPESPDNLQNLFLLPHDVDYLRISSTGFPMWDIETSLKRFIRAKRVIIIADACHAAGVGEQFDIARRAGRGIRVNPIGEGFGGLTSVGSSVCVLCAAEASQFSQEGQKWAEAMESSPTSFSKGLKAKRTATMTAVSQLAN